jgi:hypothetical protein
MVKQLNLPLRIYEDLLRVSEELSLMAKKPISPSMTIDLLMDIYRAHLNNPCALDTFSMQLQTADVMSPQEFDRYWDEPTKTVAAKKKQNAKKP